MKKYDIILKGGKVIDPANGIEKNCDIAINKGYIESISEELDYRRARQVIDVSSLLVIPGIVDSHVHILRPNSKAAGYRMLVKAGVTTAIEFKGPVDRVIEEIVPYGYGLNVGVLNGIFPGSGIKNKKGTSQEISDAVNKGLESGALGMKIIGGHFPLEPETAADIIEVTNREKGYVAYHAGSTRNGSNIKGMEEAIELAKGLPLHVAHINAYCRGMINHPLEELKKAMELLRKSPNIISESHLAPYNSCSGEIDSMNLPKSHVTRNCLKMFRYEVSKEGLGKAILDKIAGVYIRIGQEMDYVWGQEAFNIWEKEDYKVNVSFPVNLRISALACAVEKDREGKFIVDAISTDGGAIPRNFILSYGVNLVKLGAITLKDLVWKSSYVPAQMFGLVNKGHLGVGADADIAVVNPSDGKVYMTIIDGKVCMVNNYLINRPGKLLITQRGKQFIKSKDIPYEVIDLNKSIFYKGREAMYNKEM